MQLVEVMDAWLGTSVEMLIAMAGSWQSSLWYRLLSMGSSLMCSRARDQMQHGDPLSSRHKQAFAYNIIRIRKSQNEIAERS